MTRPNDNRQMVLFIQNCSPYLSGERAAFNPVEAKRLRDRKIVTFVDTNVEKELPLITEEEAGTKKVKDNGDSEQDVDNIGSESGAGEGPAKGKKSKTGGGKKRRARLGG